jgi:ribosomal protein S4E
MTKIIPPSATVKDGDRCKVVGGAHQGKSGIARDLNISKTGHLTITVVQENGERFKTLGKNVVVEGSRKTPAIRSTRSRVRRAPG